MEQRIKVVWILSLAAILLLSGGQAYWLRNQYQYMTLEQMDEISHSIELAIQENDSLRSSLKAQDSTLSNMSFYNINISQDKVVNELILGTILSNLSKEEENKKAVSQPEVVYKDTFFVEVPNSSRVNLNSMAELYQLEKKVPFTVQQFDSLLAFHLEDHSFSSRLKVSEDSVYQWDPIRKQAGTLLHPVLEICYPYNPLQHQSVIVRVNIVPHKLLARMGWQLMGSFLLILLLGLCLLFQIKTILKQQRIDELRKNFVNTLIHELKRPVQALKMCVAFLNDKAMRTDEQAMDEVIRDSMSELDNLSAYLSKLREMTRANNNCIEQAVSSFDIHALVAKLTRLQHLPADKNISFDLHFSEERIVTADPIHISSMISNLIENAVKYSGNSVTIRIECILEHQKFKIRVIDTGIGIPASELNRVFDKFYRGSNLPDRSIPGIGLGLSYVKLLVEAYHGSISLKSKPGEGTEIEITLPQSY